MDDYYSGGEMEGEELASDFNLLDRVRVYVSNFYRKMSDNKVSDVRQLYCKEWQSITQAYYKEAEWPRADEVASLCDNNEVFLLCYTELYYRHIFVNGEPLIHHRFESWNNYRQLFDMFLDNTTTRALILPSEWVNDMVDEFLYQFQDFCRYKHDLQNLSEEERTLLEENSNVWQTETVLGYLISFVERSNITTTLQAKKGSGPMLHSMRMPILQSIGYFSIFGLCRVHCLLADYRLAVQALEAIDIDDKRALFTRVPACHITLFYYLGFSYMMMRRYADSVNVFSAVLLAHRGTKERNTSYADSQISSKYDKIRSLTAISTSLSPGIRVDQQVHHIVLEKHGDNSTNLSRRDDATFEKLFNHACPKFIVPGTPNFADIVNRHQDAYRLQLRWFLYEVRQRQSLPTVRSYLKLYTSIPISKLAKFCDMPQEKFREYLLSLKFSSNQIVHEDGTAPLDGKSRIVNDVHFYIVGDMVFVDESKQPQRYSQYFLTHALKFQQAIDDLHELKKVNKPRKGGDRQ
mmetsp:Transcript_16343/g.26627  ORF Transcript_16343/g.26627 Transcript_16343/m.26627 type:complete len:520 (+) Transcript_16343:179-1738(+)|eukprot:CAMPEP_0203787178 /NCGR_PEP_ID=MMETSP0100_2-20121128/2075_1 /ASSEMBLY_ACC=CAM_ASM_000210 /TAXON_ID=96639 /ORGANISM=" , Strain NY0313808BC1" /LENGTH=519 /DNA_ID=CAMNT_0050689637 /DNA_START=294 /DNA_END=1853 /DNA_ORIENTATION=+